MKDINLTTLARTVAADSGLHDPREIAEKMLAGMSSKEMAAALRATLPGYVRDVIGSQQRQAMRQVFRPNRSAKVAQRRDWWAEMLASSVFVDGEWKSFGDASGVPPEPFGEGAGHPRLVGRDARVVGVRGR